MTSPPPPTTRRTARLREDARDPGSRRENVLTRARSSVRAGLLTLDIGDMKQLLAYQFRSQLTIEQMFARLGERSSWAWHERENDAWGRYIAAAPVPSARHAQVKILVDPDDGDVFAVNVRFESDEEAAEGQFDDLRETLFSRVLPTIDARELTETDSYE